MRYPAQVLLAIATIALAACDGPAGPELVPSQANGGAIRAIVLTAGRDLDADGYLLQVDGGTAARLGANDEHVFSDLREGAHEVIISDIASHCGLSGTATQTVTVTAGTTVDVRFQLGCAWRGPQLLEPVPHAIILQNTPTVPCSADTTSGRGLMIDFDWSDASHPSGIAAYEIVLQHEGSTYAALDETTTDSQVRWVRCHAFVIDQNRTGWTWSVRAISTDGEASLWSSSDLSFGPCRLDNGRACYAPAQPSTGSESPGYGGGQGNP